MLNKPFGIYNFEIKSFHADQNGKLTLPALFHFLQECAWDNARQNNFGYEFLNENNAFWVLSKVLVQIDDYPEWKDEIKIKTWPKGSDGFFAIRDFEVYVNDKVIGRATSYWLILDQTSRRPKKLDEFNFVHENFLQEQAINRKLGKIKILDELEVIETRKVYYSDLDVNKHVNNATYVRWILDSLFALNENRLISEFEINFISELNLNEQFKIRKLKNDDSFWMLLNESEKEVCKAQLK